MMRTGGACAKRIRVVAWRAYGALAKEALWKFRTLLKNCVTIFADVQAELRCNASECIIILTCHCNVLRQ